MVETLFRDRDRLKQEPLEGMRQVKIAFDEPLYRRVKAAAMVNNTSIAEIVRVAVSRLLDALDEVNRKDRGG